MITGKTSKTEIVRFHQGGKSDHLQVLKKQYLALKRLVTSNKTLSKAEKQAQLKELTKEFHTAQQDISGNLY